jgi:hypothetical protein
MPLNFRGRKRALTKHERVQEEAQATEAAVTIDADVGVAGPEVPAHVYTPNLNTISLGRIDYFTVKQRKALLRGRLRGWS